MNEHFIDLTDGTRLDVKINFATLYYIKKTNVEKLIAKKKPTEEEMMEAAARLIYVMLRSNGRNVNFEEAICLVPFETEKIELLFEEFAEKLGNYKKKEEARQNMRKMQ